MMGQLKRTESLMPNVILVDDQDHIIGEAEKLAAHEQGLLHRAFSVFIFSQGQDGIASPQLLLQQRAAKKYHCGGLWTNACCSHPAPGEDFNQAVADRLQFEMGIAADLTSVGVFQYRAEFDNGLVEHEVDHVFIGALPIDVPVPFNPDEVQAVQWMALSDIQAWLTQSPEDFTPWFEQALALAEKRFQNQTFATE